MNKLKTQPPRVLDATFRDGGFYTDWYFPRVVVEQTVQALFRAGVDWICPLYTFEAADDIQLLDFDARRITKK